MHAVTRLFLTVFVMWHLYTHVTVASPLWRIVTWKFCAKISTFLFFFFFCCSESIWKVWGQYLTRRRSARTAGIFWMVWGQCLMQRKPSITCLGPSKESVVPSSFTGTEIASESQKNIRSGEGLPPRSTNKRCYLQQSHGRLAIQGLLHNLQSWCL